MKAKQRNQMGVGTLALLAVFLLAPACHAQGLSMRPPSIANAAGQLAVRFGIDVPDLPILKGELDDGVTLELICEVGLDRPHDYWLDQTILTGTYASSLRYDPLRQEYVMTPGNGEEPLRDKDIGRLVKEGWNTIEIPLGSWAVLERGEKYRLRVSTALNEKDAPPGFMRYLYFWSLSPGAENAFQLDFTY